jgi:glycosyltransferase involved in cell wall biosynthesis
MSQQPLISVVIPLYNKARWVKRAVDSVLAQSYGHFEIVVVDDGSTDESLRVIEQIADQRVRCVSQSNAGVSAARNRGIHEANGQYVAFLDADDAWKRCHLESLVEGFYRFPEAVMLADRLEDRLQGPDSDGLAPFSCEEEAFGGYHQLDYLQALSQDQFPIHIGSIAVSRALLLEQKILFCVSMRLGEDINWMLRVSREGRVMRSEYIGMIYCHDDAESAMHQRASRAVLTPHFFAELDIAQWSREDQKRAKRFLRREYLKKAYQNHGAPFRGAELNTAIGTVQIGLPMVVPYLMLRVIPHSWWRWMKQRAE